MDQLATYLPGILLAYTAFLIGIASPGPNVLAVMGTSMSVDRRSGIALSFGVSFGSLCWALLTAFGLSAILVTYASAITVIKIVGGLYLLWLAYKSLRSAASKQDVDAKNLEGGRRTPAGYFLRGFVIQMTNPKAALSWVAIISLGLDGTAPIWVAFVIVAGTAILSLTIHFLYAVAFSTPFMVGVYASARRWIQGLLGTFFAFAGIKLLMSRS
jgi:threonine/homoserine/homoserine lactone efflux protein